MTEAAAPLELRAIEGFSNCLAKSTELAFDESSRQCERELVRMKLVIAIEPPVR